MGRERPPPIDQNLPYKDFNNFMIRQIVLTTPQNLEKPWRSVTPGIPDDMFKRLQGVPITKEEIRAIQISKARLRAGDTVHDIGCGSGSISVEAALQVGGDGLVTGVDRNPDAIRLCNYHSEKFGVTVRTMRGEAVDVIPTLPVADAIFVGGTGGQTAEILSLCRPILKPAGRIVVGTIQIETLAAVLDVIHGSDYVDVDVTGITVLKSRRTSTGTMMLARNPVTIVSASVPD